MLVRKAILAMSLGLIAGATGLDAQTLDAQNVDPQTLDRPRAALPATVSPGEQQVESGEGVPAIAANEAACTDFTGRPDGDDGRVQAVREYLWRNQCPVTELAGTFVHAADLNGIDYRLLPVLAVLETGCGHMTRNHNLFGWANGRKAFASFEQAIHFVAQRLRLAPHYAGKSTLEKLRMYNRRGSYRAKILRTMETIVPEPNPDGLAAGY